MDASLNNLSSQLTSMARSIESQGLNSLVTGFSFAAAIAWMDVVRAVVSSVMVKSKNGVMNAALVGLLTTLLSVVVFLVLSRLSNKVREPQQPVYAVM
jgi:hypothetical protein